MQRRTDCGAPSFNCYICNTAPAPKAQDHHRNEGKNITGTRGPICLLRDCIFYYDRKATPRKS